MKSEFIMQSSLLDILFENRNKQYGAYNLRKTYAYHLGKALSVVFVFAALIFWLTQTKFYKTRSLPPFIPEHEVHVYDFEENLIMPEKPKERAATVTVKKGSQPTNNIVITNETVNPITGEEGIESGVVDGLVTHAPDPLPAGNHQPAEESLPAAPAPAIDKESPLMVAEQMPAFPGGLPALRKFLLNNLNNPDHVEAGEEKTVRIKFIVGYDGVLKGFEIIEDGGRMFNNEVIRVLKKMPRWIPGKSNGQNVSVFFVLPVKFNASE